MFSANQRQNLAEKQLSPKYCVWRAQWKCWLVESVCEEPLPEATGVHPFHIYFTQMTISWAPSGGTHHC